MPNTTSPTPTDRTTPPALHRPLAGSRVLVLAPTTDETQALVMQLAADDVDVITAPSAEMARVRLYGEPPTAVLLASELEQGTGYAALDEIQALGAIDPDCPVIAYSRQADPLSRLRALQRGCQDFLAVPIFYPELVARLQIAIDRGMPQRAILKIRGGLTIDLRSRAAAINGQSIELSALEYGLLVKLARDPERVWTKAEILRDVWGTSSATKSRTLDSHACRLRQKLRDARPTGGAKYVQNIWSVGYRLTSGEM